MDFRQLMRGKPSTIGKITWWGPEPTAIQIKDTEQGVAIRRPDKGPFAEQPGDLVLVHGVGFPADGLYELAAHPDDANGANQYLVLVGAEGFPPVTEGWLSTQQDWSVYDAEALPMAEALRLSQIREVEKLRPEVERERRQLENADKLAKADELKVLIEKMQTFRTASGYNALAEYCEIEAPTAKQRASIISVLDKSESEVMAEVKVEIFANRPIDLKAIEAKLSEEWQKADPDLAAMALGMDKAAISDFRESALDEHAAALTNEIDLVHLLAEEIELLCRMPGGLIGIMVNVPGYPEIIKTIYMEILAMAKGKAEPAPEGNASPPKPPRNSRKGTKTTVKTS